MSHPLGHCSPTFTYTTVCYTDNTYTSVATCPAFLSITDTTFGVVSNDYNDAGVYYVKVNIAASTTQTESFTFTLTVDDGCALSTLDTTNPGDQTYDAY